MKLSRKQYLQFAKLLAARGSGRPVIVSNSLYLGAGKHTMTLGFTTSGAIGTWSAETARKVWSEALSYFD